MVAVQQFERAIGASRNSIELNKVTEVRSDVKVIECPILYCSFLNEGGESQTE